MTQVKFKIRKGDTVKVLSGKDKGKTGTVLRVIPAISKAVVENINLHTRFQRAKKAGDKGVQVSFPAGLPISKLQVIDPNTGKPTRVKVISEDGKRIRVGKESGKNI